MPRTSSSRTRSRSSSRKSGNKRSSTDAFNTHTQTFPVPSVIGTETIIDQHATRGEGEDKENINKEQRRSYEQKSPSSKPSSTSTTSSASSSASASSSSSSSSPSSPPSSEPLSLPPTHPAYSSLVSLQSSINSHISSLIHSRDRDISSLRLLFTRHLTRLPPRVRSMTLNEYIQQYSGDVSSVLLSTAVQRQAELESFVQQTPLLLGKTGKKKNYRELMSLQTPVGVLMSAQRMTRATARKMMLDEEIKKKDERREKEKEKEQVSVEEQKTTESTSSVATISNILPAPITTVSSSSTSSSIPSATASSSSMPPPAAIIKSRAAPQSRPSSRPSIAQALTNKPPPVFETPANGRRLRSRIIL